MHKRVDYSVWYISLSMKEFVASKVFALVQIIEYESETLADVGFACLYILYGWKTKKSHRPEPAGFIKIKATLTLF